MLPMQRIVRDRCEAGFMRPGFEDRAFFEQLFEPLRLVHTEPGKQHEIRAARDDVDGIDLQYAHAFDRGKHVRFACTWAWPRKQALRGEMEVARLLDAEVDRRSHVVLESRPLERFVTTARRQYSTSRRKNCIEPIRRARDTFQMRILESVVVIDPHGLVLLAVLD